MALPRILVVVATTVLVLVAGSPHDHHSHHEQAGEKEPGVPVLQHIKVPPPPHRHLKGHTSKGPVRVAPGRHEVGHKPTAVHKVDAKKVKAMHEKKQQHSVVEQKKVEAARQIKDMRAMASMKKGLASVHDRTKNRLLNRERAKELDEGLAAFKAR